jgi:hypothetical protein
MCASVKCRYSVVLAIYASGHNRISSCVIVCMLDSSAVDGGSEHRSGPTKDYENGIYCVYDKHAPLRRKSKYRLLGIMIICPIWASCLSVDCCFSELAL